MNGQYRECPFCDKDGFQEVEEATFKTHTEYRVACANCGAHGPNEISVEQAIKMWNLRRPFDTLQAQLIGLNQRITTFAGQLQAWGYENAARELISEILGGIVDAPDYYTLQDELAKKKARSESLGAVLSYAVNMITQMASVIEIRGRLPEMFKKTHDKYHKLAHLVLEWYKGESDPRLICEEAKRLKNTPESEW